MLSCQWYNLSFSLLGEGEGGIYASTYFNLLQDVCDILNQTNFE